MKNTLTILSTLLCFLFSCSKDTGSSSPPTNLVVNATISADNSGTVTFVASATNATTYEYEFGNGSLQIVPSGTIIYKYISPGTYTVTVTAKNASGKSLSKSIQVTINIMLALAWSDEFDIDGAPDASKWGYDLGAGGWGNVELQHYTNRPENVIISGGTLKIKAIKENFSGANYTSARLLSKDKYAFKYGKVEARAKLPAGVGTWPAIWMLGSNINTVPWPACGEIDIMEHLGRDLNKIYGTLHYPGRSGANADGSTKIISNATTEFHKYAVEWTAATIKISVDDEVFHVVANSGSTPFNNNFFLIMNIAMGGNFAGAIDPAVTAATMEVDYIRVYR
ncbi:MAG: family 16 glycosylhydrolase [Bacteroidota bacterium]